MKKAGRPSIYTDKIADKILGLIASGKSLRKICEEDEKLPHRSTIHEWIASNINGFADQYARATSLRAESIFEETLEIADHSAEDHTAFTGINVVKRDQLRVDTRKWILSKMEPKKYGDKVQHDLSGTPLVSNVIVSDQATKDNLSKLGSVLNG